MSYKGLLTVTNNLLNAYKQKKLYYLFFGYKSLK